MRPRSFRKDSYHALLIATQGGVILDLHKDMKAIKVDERHIRHHGRYTGKDLKKEIAKIRELVS